MNIPIDDVQLGDVFLDCGTEHTVDSIARHGGGIVSFSGTAPDGRRVSRRFARGSVASFVRRGPEPVNETNEDAALRLHQDLGITIRNMREQIVNYRARAKAQRETIRDRERALDTSTGSFNHAMRELEETQQSLARAKKVIDAKNDLLENRSNYITDLRSKLDGAEKARDAHFQRVGELESQVLTLQAIVHDVRRQRDEATETIALLRKEKAGSQGDSPKMPQARYYTTVDRSVAWEIQPDFSGKFFYKEGAGATYPEGTFSDSLLGTGTLPEINRVDFLKIVNSWKGNESNDAN